MIYTGGWQITSVEWVGSGAIEVTFRADEWTGKIFQVYVGKKLAGWTGTTTDRSVVVPMPYATKTTPITMLVVDPADAATDFSAQLCWAPWNFYCISWSVPSPLPADLKRFEIVMSRTAGAAYDSTNVVGVVDYEPNRTSYEFALPEIQATGDWEVAVIPRDDARPAGNAGAVAQETIAATVYPDDIPLAADGTRFSVSVSAGVATATFSCP